MGFAWAVGVAAEDGEGLVGAGAHDARRSASVARSMRLSSAMSTWSLSSTGVCA
jgi:hypothetical protein